jgi:hypothetical protein
MSATLGDKRPSYFTIKTWVATFIEYLERSWRRTEARVLENVDASHSTMLDDPRIVLTV